MSVAGQRYRAVLAVISEGRTVSEVAAAVGVSRQSLQAWLGRSEADGLALNHLVDGFGQITPLGGGVGGEAAMTATAGTISSMD
jgi:hypothetical protein